MTSLTSWRDKLKEQLRMILWGSNLWTGCNTLLTPYFENFIMILWGVLLLNLDSNVLAWFMWHHFLHISSLFSALTFCAGFQTQGCELDSCNNIYFSVPLTVILFGEYWLDTTVICMQMKLASFFAFDKIKCALRGK